MLLIKGAAHHAKERRWASWDELNTWLAEQCRQASGELNHLEYLDARGNVIINAGESATEANLPVSDITDDTVE